MLKSYSIICNCYLQLNQNILPWLNEATNSYKLRGMIIKLVITITHVNIHCDSARAIKLVNYLVYHEGTKYIGKYLHFIRDMIKS